MSIDILQKIVKENDDLKHYHIPAVVTAYDYGTVTVQPSVMHKDDAGTLTKLPLIYDVPVVLPRATNGNITFPPAAGDCGLLIFTDHSLEVWKKTGLVKGIDPADTRKSDLTDAVYLPGLYQHGKGFAIANDAMVIQSGLPIKVNGNKIAIGNSSAELLQIVNDLMSIVSSIQGTTPVGGGTVTFTAIEPYTHVVSPLNTAIASVVAKLALIKGTL